MALNRIVVVGAGVMGQGIAEAIATTGTDVILLDRTAKLAEKGIERIGENIDHEIDKWGLTLSDKKAILSRIVPSTDLQVAKLADLIVEAIPEKLRQKRELFQRLDDLCPEETVFITNTSTLSITELASVTNREDRVIGMHFLSPVPKIPVIEIVRGLKTSDNTYEIARQFADHLGKTPVQVYEYPGYVTTRVIMPLLNEAMHVLMEGVATAEDIDTAMKLGFGFTVGPLALADMMGLDVVMSQMENLLEELSEHKYNPCPLLRKMVRAGYLGVKTGQGFFKYDKEGNRIKGETPFVDAERGQV
ncbi:MAG: 3-hydroxybutyryl-CoA dehydrogenase [candidate division Zixibacteria bacterium HGW-Zixibacteria-1]|nr:MAG: 3-hydroxybutyryl-CoA dehydrogenase [candidate division Zixibacteria bacterium HGW-Zixibacteria-1]